MKITDLSSPKGAHKRPKIVGRGSGSGHGKTSCRGQKGQSSRSGEHKKPGFEGGQISFIERIPKRGFTNKFKKTYQVVNLGSLNEFDKDSIVTPKELKLRGVIASSNVPVKILGDGTLTKALTVKAHGFSKSAIERIEKIGGKYEILKRC